MEGRESERRRRFGVGGIERKMERWRRGKTRKNKKTRKSETRRYDGQCDAGSEGQDRTGQDKAG